MADPSVILLDEPTVGLPDPVANSLLRETVPGLLSSAAGSLFGEQRARLALEVADRAYVLVAGAVQHTASAESAGREAQGLVAQTNRLVIGSHAGS